MCHAFTGYNPDIVQYLSQTFNCSNIQVFAISMLHMNLTFEQACAVLYPYIGNRLFSPTWFRKSIMEPVLAASNNVGNMADVERRFRVREENYFMCTSIVDGLPVFRRGPQSLYNGKHATKYWTFQVFIMIDGCPLAWSGPFEGSMHDSECLAGSDIYG